MSIFESKNIQYLWVMLLNPILDVTKDTLIHHQNN